MKTMTTRCLPLALTALGLLLAAPARAAITVPGANNTDGELLITANTVIDLSQAVDAPWDSDNTAHAGKGVYDAGKWAVVFKYSKVTVNSGATVTFKNHPSRAPVVWLVDGDVKIDGVVSLDGQQGVATPSQSEPGPGGFRGGAGYYSAGFDSGGGFGVGGGSINGSSGSYGTKGGGSTAPYGNPSLVPLLGGSGGAAHQGGYSAGAGAGGGAILIAAKGGVSVGGMLRADGGSQQGWPAGAGSGGGVRIVAETFEGSGTIRTLGGGGYQGPGGLGRIRIERVSAAGSPTVVPDPSVVPLSSDATALLWPPDNGPTVRILSVGGQPVSADPRASFGVTTPDVALPQVSSTQVVLETVNVEEASEVAVRLTPRANAPAVTVSATVDSIVNDSPLTLRWVATLPVQVGYSAVQVKVVRP